MRTRLAAAALWGGLGLLTVVLAGCGGGSSSNTGPSSGGGGSSGAVVQGQLVNRRAANGESAVIVLLRTALGVGLAEAADGDLIANVTVTLTRQEDGATTTTQTNASGEFTFSNVLPGTYTISVEGKTVDPVLTAFVVGPDDVANITGAVTENTVTFLNGVTVVAQSTDATIVLNNDAQVAILLNIAKAAGLVSADPVLQLRLAGWGWGRIALHFNVHPGVIGLGHGGVSDADIETFRAAHGQGNGKGKGKKNGQA